MCNGFQELHWVAPYDRLLPLGERSTEFRQGDILQLPDPLSGNSELLTDFFESFRVAAGQSVSVEDNLPLAVVQYVQKLTDCVAQVLISEQLERCLGIFITDHLPEFGRIIIADRSIKRRRANRNRLQLRNLRAGNTDLFGKFFVGRFKLCNVLDCQAKISEAVMDRTHVGFDQT